jgi:hypothetical protein
VKFGPKVVMIDVRYSISDQFEPSPRIMIW